MSNFPVNELRRLASGGKVALLDPTERAIVVLRLGWDRGGESRSQQEVAEALKLSQSSVSISEREAKDKLKLMNDRTEWFNNHSTLVSLAMWLDHECRFSDASEAIRLFEKPWNYEEEYEEYLGAMEAEAAGVTA